MVEWVDEMARQAGAAGLLVLFVAAALEYVFPPFPGDTITIFGGIYAMRGGLPVLGVFAVVMAGSLVGATLDYAVGVWVGRRIASEPRDRRHLRFVSHDQIVEWEARFRQRGVWWLVLNRFLPGVRGPIFFAAGASGLRYRTVLLWGGLSSVAWNAALFGAGYAVGGQAERLEALVRTYGRIAWAAFALVVALLATRWLWTRARRRAASARQAR